MKKRVLSILGSIVLSVSMLAGCGGSAVPEASPAAESTAASSSAAASESPTTETAAVVESFDLSWYVDLSWWKWNGSDWGTDTVSKIIQEKTGANVTFTVPAADDGQQLATMIASDALPDVITVEGWWNAKNRALTNRMASEGYILPLNDLVTRPEVIRDDVFSWFSEADGKTYLLPNYAYSKKDLKPGEQLVPNGCITIRKDLWEKIGSPDMSTAESFLAACQKVKDEIKEYNGQPIIPIQVYEGVGNSALWIGQYFATPFEDRDGNYLYDFLQPQYKEGIKFLNAAFRRGLIGEANFSDNRDLLNEKVASGRVFAQITAPQDFGLQMQALYDTDPKAVYIPVVLKNSAGEDPVLQDIRGMGWLTTAITKSAKDPKKIMGLFEWLMSDEGQISCAYGIEGETYQKNSDGSLSVLQTVLDDITAGNGKKYGLGALMMLDNWAFRRNLEAPATDPRILATNDTYIKAPVAKYSYDYTAAGLKIDPTDSRVQAMTEVSVKIANLRNENLARLVVAKNETEFDTLWEQTIADMKDLGLDGLIQYNNDMFKNAKKSLGVEFAWPRNQK